MKKRCFGLAIVLSLAGCAAVLAESRDPLSAVLNQDSLAAWKRAEPAVEYDKDNVFELINGEAELYFPYNFKRVVAAEYADAAEPGMTVSLELYELGSLLDAFGVYSNYRDEESKSAAVGTEAVAGSTQVLFYQDKFFVKARTNKTDRQQKLLEFARELSKTLPQQKSAPPESALLNVKGVIPMSQQYIAQSVLGYEFFNNGLVAKAFWEDAPKDAKPLRVFVLMQRVPNDAQKAIADYVAYLDENQATHAWVETGGAKVLKAEDPLHKGVLLKQHGRYVVGVAKLTPETDGLPLLNRLDERLLGKS